MKDYEKVHLVTGDDEERVYFRQFRKCSDGRFVCGVGQTEEQAVSMALEKLHEMEVFLGSDARNRLRMILNKFEHGSLCSSAMEDAIRAIGEILLGETK